MSQDNNEDDKNGNRVNGRSLMVWVVLIAAVALLVNYSAPSAAHVQKLGVTQVLSYAKEGKLKNARLLSVVVPSANAAHMRARFAMLFDPGTDITALRGCVAVSRIKAMTYSANR